MQPIETFEINKLAGLILKISLIISIRIIAIPKNKR
jgi:hypothetical protein